MRTRQTTRQPARTSGRRMELRARDAVARLMLQRLVVPNIYFDAPWPSHPNRVDMLAIDRAGAGDVNVFEFKSAAGATRTHLQRLFAMPASHRWLVVVSRPHEEPTPVGRSMLDAPQCMGRIGVIEVEQDSADTLDARVAVPAERFGGSFYDLADRFTAVTKPDLAR